jgi:hypothetical protein
MTSITRDATAYAVAAADRGADRDTIVALWRSHLANSSLMDAKFQWFYCDAPSGDPELMFLRHGSAANPVGVAGIGAREMIAHGQEIPAGILADFVVEPEHRTLYPALLLQQHVRDTGLRGRALLYGSPNEKSLPIVKRLKYAHVGNMVRFVSVLRHQTYLGRSVPRVVATVGGGVLDHVRTIYHKPFAWMFAGWQGTWVDVPDSRFDDLWRRASAFDGVIGVRDAKFLAWRFGAQPGHKYRIFALSATRDRSRIAGYAVCEESQHMLMIHDLLVDPSVEEEGVRVLIHLLGRQGYRDGFIALSSVLLAPQRIYRILADAGMVERERRALYAAFSPRHGHLQGANWYMTPADFDV